MATLPEKDTASTDPRELLKSVGLLTAEDMEILSQAQTVKELREEFRQRGITYDEEQFLLPMFRPLYQQIPGFRETVLEELEPTGVSPEMIDLYFTQSGDQPGFVFNYKHRAGEILGPETLGKFFEASRECIFYQLKSVLTGNPPSPAT